MSNEFYGILILVGLMAFIPILFLPSILAFKRRHPRRVAILAINVFLGAFGIGWIFAMAILFAPAGEDALTAPSGADVLLCPHCGFGYRLADYRADVERIECSRCRSELPRGGTA